VFNRRAAPGLVGIRPACRPDHPHRLGRGHQLIVDERIGRPSIEHVLAELLFEGAFQPMLAVDGPEVPEQVEEGSTPDPFLQFLPAGGVRRLTRRLDAADDMGLQDIGCRELQTARVHHGEDPVGRVALGRLHHHQEAALHQIAGEPCASAHAELFQSPSERGTIARQATSCIAQGLPRGLLRGLLRGLPRGLPRGLLVELRRIRVLHLTAKELPVPIAQRHVVAILGTADA